MVEVSNYGVVEMEWVAGQSVAWRRKRMGVVSTYEER